ncbi:hypothetical protein [Paenibacillus barengoltzii]|uniref:hypothetical protein n=1 Tax=Paenibacillus barengoltzii TaxID=343517 RepID=UPI000FD74EDD|nr:hypothetical protein [Paenibacillus barengoltzii]
MATKDELIKVYIDTVKEKNLLLEKQHHAPLQNEDMQNLIYLDNKLNQLIGKMIDTGLIEVEIVEG